MGIEESVFFYTRNDYLIINNLLCGNMKHLWEVAEIVNNDSKGMLQEHESGVRTLKEKYLQYYQGRVYEKLDDATKAKLIATAQQDVANIIRAMVPAGKKLRLYRTVWAMRAKALLPTYNINEIAEFKIISSASESPYMEEAGHEFYRYEITVPENGLVLELNRFDAFIRNEVGEVLLPPMKCKITNVKSSPKENCKGIIEMEYMENLREGI